MAREFRYIAFLLALTLTPAAAQGQSVSDHLEELRKKRAERILFGFIPDIGNLQFIDGDELNRRYKGVTIKGIYNITPHTDQRYIEHFSAKGETRYSEGNFSSNGQWYVKGDLLCFRYEDDSEREHCGYEFDYGDCIISYSRYEPIIGGKPADPSGWTSVNKMSHVDFDWADLSLEEAKDFSCYSLIS